jgi:hypothetical protein
MSAAELAKLRWVEADRNEETFLPLVQILRGYGSRYYKLQYQDERGKWIDVEIDYGQNKT